MYGCFIFYTLYDTILESRKPDDKGGDSNLKRES